MSRNIEQLRGELWPLLDRVRAGEYALVPELNRLCAEYKAAMGVEWEWWDRFTNCLAVAIEVVSAAEDEAALKARDVLRRL